MEDYKSNSHKSKENDTVEKKEIAKVANGKIRKKNKLTDVFISEDAKNVKNYALMEVLIPAIKKAVVDIVTDGISMIFYGETGHGKKNSNASKISYRSYYDDRREDRYESRRSNGYSYNEIVLDTRGEAEEVLSRMDEILDRYNAVSVADLYDLVGISGNYTDNKYGWTSLRSAEVVRVRDGYLLKLPRATAI